jgi:hypothetical protein
MKEKKNLLKSKTFWLNALSLAAIYGELLPPKYAATTVAVANIGMRLITDTPVGIVPQKSE